MEQKHIKQPAADINAIRWNGKKCSKMIPIKEVPRLTRPKVYRCDSRSAAITAMGFEDSDSKDCDPIDSDS